ncbi:MAG: hypothetical protein Q9M14_08525, partial [Mariprofundaceae bacterium]|nr:hypothetical protein [Mariprofundaceae bacterium]
KGSGMIQHAREICCMTQTEFGKLVAKRIGRELAYHQVVVAGWESGNRSPRRNVRNVCCYDAAKWTINEVERIVGVSLTDAQALEIADVIVESQS